MMARQARNVENPPKAGLSGLFYTIITPGILMPVNNPQKTMPEISGATKL